MSKQTTKGSALGLHVLYSSKFMSLVLLLVIWEHFNSNPSALSLDVFRTCCFHG